MPNIQIPLRLQLANYNNLIPRITVLNDENSRTLLVTMCVNEDAVFIDPCTVIGNFMNPVGERISVQGNTTSGGLVEVPIPSNQTFMMTGLLKCSITMYTNNTPTEKITTPAFNIYVENAEEFTPWEADL